MNMEQRALRYAEGVASMIRVDTVRRPGEDKEQFDRLHEVLRELFPNVFAVCKVWELESSLLVRWSGRAHRALVLMSHQDVVPAGGVWRYPPFSGTIADGKLWGRGTMDVKGNLYCIFKAIDELIAEGYTPAWDVYIATSHEEEVGGNKLIVNFLRDELKVTPELLIDEGSAVQLFTADGLSRIFAMVAVAEKGYLDVRCVARSRGGHSSAPQKWSPLPSLGAFMCAIEERELFPLRMNAASAEMYRRLAAYSEAPEQREKFLALAAQKPGWQELLTGSERNLLATTCVFTMASGSSAANVIPQEASVTCNIRLAPGESVQDALDAMRPYAEKHGVELQPLRAEEASPITDPCGPEFARVEAAIQKAWQGVPVLPFLLQGGTDTKHFVSLCPSCFRFTALKLSPEQQTACHGIDENIDISELPHSVDFFRAVITGLEQEEGV